jgi:hypothetical protein
MTPADRKRELQDALAALGPIPIPGLREKTAEELEEEAAFDAFIEHPAVGGLLVEYAEALADEDEYVKDTIFRKQDWDVRDSGYWQYPKIELDKLPEEIRSQWRDGWEDWFREVADGIEIVGTKATVHECPHCGGSF